MIRRGGHVLAWEGQAYHLSRLVLDTPAARGCGEALEIREGDSDVRDRGVLLLTSDLSDK